MQAGQGATGIRFALMPGCFSTSISCSGPQRSQCGPEAYAKWLDGLRDARARARVLVRVERLAARNPGDVRPVGEGVSELRIDYGPGYRVYFKEQGRTIVVLLAGGDKRSQSRDIETALRLARNL